MFSNHEEKALVFATDSHMGCAARTSPPLWPRVMEASQPRSSPVGGHVFWPLKMSVEAFGLLNYPRSLNRVLILEGGPGSMA